jgi:hypothetical protein
MHFLVSAGGYVATVRAGMEVLDYPEGPVRVPMAPLSAESLATLETMLKDITDRQILIS